MICLSFIIGCLVTSTLLWVCTGRSPFVQLAHVGLWAEAVRRQWISTMNWAIRDFCLEIGERRRDVAGEVSDEIADRRRTLIK